MASSTITIKRANTWDGSTSTFVDSDGTPFVVPDGHSLLFYCQRPVRHIKRRYSCADFKRLHYVTTVSEQPTVQPATITGVQQGSFNSKQLSVKPLVTPPSLYTGVVPIDGTFSALQATIQPAVATALLTGVQRGLFTVSTVNDQAVVLPATLRGVQQGTFSTLSASVQPAVTAPTLTSAEPVPADDSFTIPSLQCRATVRPATLTGNSGVVNNLPFRLVVPDNRVYFSAQSDKITFNVNNDKIYFRV